MDGKAITRYIRQSPRKMRIVLNEVRGQNVDKALNFLHFSPLKAATQIEKTLRSAVANLLQNAAESQPDTEKFKVSECFVDGGPFLKRFRAASMGRISKLNKPTSHLTIVVTDEEK